MSSHPRQAIEEFVDRLTAALGDVAVSRQVAEAGIVVELAIDGHSSPHVYLLLDRVPCLVTLGPIAESPDVRLWLPAGALSVFWRDEAHLALGILSGEIRFEGVVRKLLRVMPVLRDGVRRTTDPARGFPL